MGGSERKRRPDSKGRKMRRAGEEGMKCNRKWRAKKERRQAEKMDLLESF